MNCFYGRILCIDVGSRSYSIDPVAPEVLEACLGGKGLATRLLLDRNPAGVDPLGPDNRLIFATGPLCGGSAWGTSRYGVFTKSPQTGFYAESYSGGRTPEAIDSAGFDAVVITGASPTPLALTVHPEGCEFHDASSLWGLDVFSTEDAAAAFASTKEGYGRPGTVVIGPAGENLGPLRHDRQRPLRCAAPGGPGWERSWARRRSRPLSSRATASACRRTPRACSPIPRPLPRRACRTTA